MTKENISTLELIQQAQGQIGNLLSQINKLKHSKSSLKPIYAELEKSKNYLRLLTGSYETHEACFETRQFRQAFKNYQDILNTIEKCIQHFEANGQFLKFMARDKIKKLLIKLLGDIELSTSQLKQMVTIHTSLKEKDIDRGKLESLERKMEDTITSLNRTTKLLTQSDMDRLDILKDIDEVKKGGFNVNEVLQSIDIEYDAIEELQNVKEMEGDRSIIIKRKYQDQVVAERYYDNFTDTNLKYTIAKEVYILKKLGASSTNIIKVYGIRSDMQQAGLIMEYCGLGSLRQVIDNKYLKDDLNLKVSMTRDIVDAVGYLHSLRILHRNLSTSAILVTNDKKIKLAGFESSRESSVDATMILVNGKEQDLFRSRWTAPEHLVNDSQPHKFSSDIYSLGMILWSLWSEQFPYIKLRAVEALKSYISNGNREDLNLLPPGLSQLVDQCWNSNPTLRPETKDIVDDLESILPNTNDDENEDGRQLDLPQQVNIYETHLMDFDIDETNDEELIHSHILEFTEDHMAEAIRLHKVGERSQSLRKFQELAQVGHIDAFYYLGYYYYWGVDNVLTKDERKGLDYLEMAASSGNPDALDHLGSHHYANGVQLDKLGNKDMAEPAFKKALKYFNEAVVNGSPKAHYHLGVCHAKGHGTNQDSKLAISHFKIAASKGVEIAKKALLKVKKK